MFGRWSKSMMQSSRRVSSSPMKDVESLRKDLFLMASCRRGYSSVAAADTDPVKDTILVKSPDVKVNLNKMFWSKPCSLALALDSPLRVEEPKYAGFMYAIMVMLLFYSKQSKSIRGANIIYRRILFQVDKPPIYDVFNLEKTFTTTFSLLILHMWLCLRRLKEEGEEGTEFGQYLYDIYNHDVELRAAKAGVRMNLSKWMRELEKIFYGNIVAYNTAMEPEAKQDELSNVIWRNVFSDDGVSKPDDAALRAVQAMARYARRESICLSLTDKEAMYFGNFKFTSLGNPSSESVKILH